jgi:hypothetical protein
MIIKINVIYLVAIEQLNSMDVHPIMPDGSTTPDIPCQLIY